MCSSDLSLFNIQILFQFRINLKWIHQLIFNFQNLINIRVFRYNELLPILARLTELETEQEEEEERRESKGGEKGGKESGSKRR